MHGRNEHRFKLTRREINPPLQHAVKVCRISFCVTFLRRSIAVYLRFREIRTQQRADLVDLHRDAMLFRTCAQMVRDIARRGLHDRVDLRVIGDNIQLGETCRHGDRIARQRAGLINRSGRCDLLHEGAAAGISTDRHTAADDLAVGHKVGLHAEIFLCAACRETEARDDLIEDEQRAMPVAERAQTL